MVNVINSFRFGASYAYQDAILAKSPLFYGRMDQVSGGVAWQDSSGLGHDGNTITGTSGQLGDTGLMTTIPGLCLRTTGSTINDFIHTVADAAWMDQSAFTVVETIRPSATFGASYCCLLSRDGNSGSRGWNFFVFNNKLRVFEGNTSLFVDGGTTLNANTTYQVAMSYSGGTVALNVNGVNDGGGSLAITTTLANPIALGWSFAGTASRNFGWAGKTDEVAYFGSALSHADLAAIYAAR